MPFRSHPYRSWLLLALLCALLAAQLPVRLFVEEATAATCSMAETIAATSALPAAAMPVRPPLAAGEGVDLAPAPLVTARSSDPFSILRI